jgi:ABC-type Zn uptake system ZnuABC Zn-binding protein ZnuA
VVAASLSPLASLVAFVAGDRLPVVSLLPPGRSPHDYEPTPADLHRLRRAILVVEVGGSVDAWMRRAALGVMGEEVRFLSMAEGRREGTEDPHLWLDLDAVSAFVPRLADRLIALDPEGEAGYRHRSEAFLDSLAALDREARAWTSPVSGVPFALLHPAFLVLVERYGLNCVAVLHRHPEGETSPRRLGETTRRLRASAARWIFAEPQLGRAIAEAVASDIGARIALLDPLGGPSAEGREDYLALVRWNLRQLVEHLDDTHH